MQKLFKAIQDKYAEAPGGVHNSFYTAIAGKFYLEESPQSITAPYCVYSLVSDIHTWQLGSTGEEFEDILLQFSIFSESSSALETENLYDKLIALYDWTNLTVSSYTACYMRRERSMLLRPEMTVLLTKQIRFWQKIIDYRILLEKS